MIGILSTMVFGATVTLNPKTAQDISTGDAQWSQEVNALTLGNGEAKSTLTWNQGDNNKLKTNYLQVSNFNFSSIPNIKYSLIDGIEVSIWRRCFKNNNIGFEFKPGCYQNTPVPACGSVFDKPYNLNIVNNGGRIEIA